MATKAPAGGSSRRTFLKCMAWSGMGVAWTLAGGVPRSALLGSADAASLPTDTLRFVQISDNHFGFAKDANPDVAATARQAIAHINAMAPQPDFVIHTGDITHLSKPGEVEQAKEVFAELKGAPMFFSPGEHDVLDDPPGALYRAHFSRESAGQGWYSFDQRGVHFISLVNVLDFGTTGLGQLGADQLKWLESDVSGLRASTPVVVFTHIPLWALYPQWGWGTADAEQALAHLRRFGSVTVLNGHIHQVMQKVEGNVSFHTAMSTAYPQPAPGTAPAPGPLKVPAERLRSVLGIRKVNLVSVDKPLAVIDESLMES